MTKLEALADAFANLNGAFDPRSRAYRNRNPGLLRAFSPKHERDDAGYRIFNTIPGGYDNLILDLKIKCTGGPGSRTGLTPENTLMDLVKCYGNSEAAARTIKNFLRPALKDENIMETTQLSYFLEANSGT